VAKGDDEGGIQSVWGEAGRPACPEESDDQTWIPLYVSLLLLNPSLDARHLPLTVDEMNHERFHQATQWLRTATTDQMKDKEYTSLMYAQTTWVAPETQE
jgi:hypothetical protein